MTLPVPLPEGRLPVPKPEGQPPVPLPEGQPPVPRVEGRRGWLVRRDEERFAAWLSESVVTLSVQGIRGFPVKPSLTAFRFMVADANPGMDRAAREELAQALFTFTVLMRPGDV